MTTWPGTLPNFVLESGYQEAAPKNLVETEMEAGPSKARRRFTATFRRFSVSMNMDGPQADTFETFYKVTCASGALPFDWVHPRTQAPMSFRFTGPPPTFVPFGGQYVRISFMLLEV